MVDILPVKEVVEPAFLTRKMQHRLVEVFVDECRAIDGRNQRVELRGSGPPCVIRLVRPEGSRFTHSAIPADLPRLASLQALQAFSIRESASIR